MLDNIILHYITLCYITLYYIISYRLDQKHAPEHRRSSEAGARRATASGAACAIGIVRGPLSRAPLIMSLPVLFLPYLAQCLYK